MELSEAGENFGRAICLGEARESLPMDRLTSDEQACVTRVGMDWERRIQERLGFLGPEPLAYPVQSRAGLQVATLGLDATGNVTLCLPNGPCAVVGQGPAAAAAVEETLALLGLSVANTPAGTATNS